MNVPGPISPFTEPASILPGAAAPVPCPGCGAEPSATRALGAAPASAVVLRDDRRFTQEAYAVYECGVCGLLFKYPTADARTLDEYYALVDFHKWETPDLYPTERLVLRALADLPAGSAILDFGCSSGRLLSRLTKRHRCYGFEPNAEAAQAATAAGLTMLPDLMADPAATPVFDAVVLVDVFEHLATPAATLDILLGRLRPGGRLVLATGNGDAPACRLDPARFWYFRTIEHVCMLTQRFARWFAESRRLELVVWERACHYEPTWREWLFQHARWFAYWSFHAPRPSPLRHLLRFLPGLRRTSGWTQPPHFVLSRDHAVTAFRREAGAD